MAKTYLNEQDVRAEKLRLQRTGVSRESIKRTCEWLDQLLDRAKTIPGGHVKKIVWDQAGGYPEHAWGYTQYTVRPFIQGYGCDGTTDENIHLIAITLCDRLDIDYAKCYRRAYPEDTTTAQARKWIAELKENAELAVETRIPSEVTEDVLIMMLSDLYQINNRSLTEVLVEELERKGWNVADFCLREDHAKQRTLATA